MNITVDELTGTNTETSMEAPTQRDVRIVGWLNEVPRLRRSSPFDAVIEQIRQTGDTTRVAQLQWDDKDITANKVNQLRKRYPDVEFTQVTQGEGRQTYARYRGEPTPNA